jgi:hypothetical protein
MHDWSVSCDDRVTCDDRCRFTPSSTLLCLALCVVLCVGKLSLHGVCVSVRQHVAKVIMFSVVVLQAWLQCSVDSHCTLVKCVCRTLLILLV